MLAKSTGHVLVAKLGARLVDADNWNLVARLPLIVRVGVGVLSRPPAGAARAEPRAAAPRMTSMSLMMCFAVPRFVRV